MRALIERAGVVLTGTDIGSGAPVLFQHGLGGDDAQVAELFPVDAGFRRLTLECRGHGGAALGPHPDLSIATFAEDVLAFAAGCGVERFAIGGVSMGAAIAVRIAASYPNRVWDLVLHRPAWTWRRAPANLRPVLEVADLLSRYAPKEALVRFNGSETARRLSEFAPDNLASLRGFFARETPTETAVLLASIAQDGPGLARKSVRSIRAPTLVIGNAVDEVHPIEAARELARTIPGARFAEVTPKATDRKRHAQQVRGLIADFLRGVLDQGS
jgi:pimeloyl-ACP methyl ester carboxylesterase